MRGADLLPGEQQPADVGENAGRRLHRDQADKRREHDAGEHQRAAHHGDDAGAPARGDADRALHVGDDARRADERAQHRTAAVDVEGLLDVLHLAVRLQIGRGGEADELSDAPVEIDDEEYDQHRKEARVENRQEVELEERGEHLGGELGRLAHGDGEELADYGGGNDGDQHPAWEVLAHEVQSRRDRQPEVEDYRLVAGKVLQRERRPVDEPFVEGDDLGEEQPDRHHEHTDAERDAHLQLVGDRRNDLLADGQQSEDDAKDAGPEHRPQRLLPGQPHGADDGEGEEAVHLEAGGKREGQARP